MRFMWFLLVVGCGGVPFESAASLSISSDADGAPSGEPLTGSERAVRDAGLDAPATEEIEGGSASPFAARDGESDVTVEAPSLPRDVMNDPWPDDVEVQPVNCFLNQVGTWSCCYGTMPALTCEGHDAKFCTYCVNHP